MEIIASKQDPTSNEKNVLVINKQPIEKNISGMSPAEKAALHAEVAPTLDKTKDSISKQEVIKSGHMDVLDKTFSKLLTSNTQQAVSTSNLNVIPNATDLFSPTVVHSSAPRDIKQRLPARKRNTAAAALVKTKKQITQKTTDLNTLNNYKKATMP